MWMCLPLRSGLPDHPTMVFPFTDTHTLENGTKSFKREKELVNASQGYWGLCGECGGGICWTEKIPTYLKGALVGWNVFDSRMSELSDFTLDV